MEPVCGEFDIPDSEYRSRIGISRSQLELLRRSPAHYQHAMSDDEEETDTAAFILGRLVHCLILEPTKVGDKFFLLPEDMDRRTLRGREEYQDILNSNIGKTLVKAPIMQQAISMATAATKHHMFAGLRENANTEGSFFFKTEHLYCKARLDMYRNTEYILDVKTTEDAGEGYQQSFVKYGTHRQLAFYGDAMKMIRGDYPEKYLILAIEKRAPFATTLFEVPDEAIRIGRLENMQSLLTLKQCLKTNEWPGYYSDRETVRLTLPDWYKNKYPMIEEREIEHGI